MTQEELIAAAIEWAEAGIPVFPCSDNKAPLTEHGFQDGELDPVKIRKLFEFFGNSAKYIGGAMGHDGLIAVDFDLYKAEGEAKQCLEEWTNSGLLPATRVHKTKSGGLHMLYRTDQPIDCKPAKGIEVKGPGGYIILPPSAGYSVLQEGLAEAPIGLINLFKQARRAKSGSSIDRLEADILSAADFHDTLTLLAARYASQGYTQAEVQTKLLAVLNGSVAQSPHHDRHARWRKLVTDDGKELSRIVTSANAKFNTSVGDAAIAETVDFDHAAAVADGFFSPIVGDMGNTATEEQTYSDDEWPFTDGYFASEERDVQTQNFALYPIYAENESVVLFAEPKTGKTAIALTTALCIACGFDLGPLKVKTPGPCLYYALEGSRAIELRVQAWKKEQRKAGAKLPESIPLWVQEGHTNFLKPEARKSEANKIIAANNYCVKNGVGPLKVIFLDTLTKAMPGGDQNSVEDTSHLFELIGLLRSGGVTATIVFVHHKARSGNARGSTNIEAEPDVLLDVTKDGEVVTLRIARARSIEDGERFQFALVGVDLGKTTQGFDLHGVYAKPIDDADAEDDLKVATVVAKAKQAIIDLGVGKHTVKDVHAALQDHIPQGGGEFRKKATGPNSAAFREFLTELVPRDGTVFRDHALKLSSHEGKPTHVIIGLIS